MVGQCIRAALTPQHTTYNTYLIEHLLEVVLRLDPGGDGVAEEDEVLHDAARVDADHGADAAEGRVLLLVVADVAQRRAPVIMITWE